MTSATRHARSLRPSVAFVLVLVLGLALGLGLAPASARPASLDPATWRGDARFLAAAVDSIHPRPYRWSRRASWDSAATDLEQRLPRLRYDQAVGGFERMLALLHDGHSRLDRVELAGHGEPVMLPLPGPGFGLTYPVRFGVFADGLWITQATSAHADLAGAHVVAIDGVSVRDAVARLAPTISADNPMWTLHLLPACLRVPGDLAAAGLAAGPDAPLHLSVVDAAGHAREADVRAGPEDPAAAWTRAPWTQARPEPLTRSLPGTFTWADLRDGDPSVFVRIRAIVGEPGRSFAAAVAQLFAHADSTGCRRMILDLRGNGGGNNYLVQPLVHAILRRPALDRTGGLFVIVDRGTFSAAVSLAADLQRETHALFVGEPTGSGPNSPGDPVAVTLPASGIVVRLSSVFWQLSDPRDPRTFIAPDLPMMPSFADEREHRDRALEAIEAWRAPATPDDTPPNQHWGDAAQLHAKLPPIAW